MRGRWQGRPDEAPRPTAEVFARPQDEAWQPFVAPTVLMKSDAAFKAQREAEWREAEAALPAAAALKAKRREAE